MPRCCTANGFDDRLKALQGHIANIGRPCVRYIIDNAQNPVRIGDDPQFLVKSDNIRMLQKHFLEDRGATPASAANEDRLQASLRRERFSHVHELSFIPINP